MTLHLRRALLAATLIPGLLSVAGMAHAEINSHTLKFAAQNQKGHPQVMGMEKFKEIVEEKSDGNIKVRLFPGGTLGGDVQTISAMQGGTIEMSVMNAGLLSGLDKEFAIVDFPFLFNTAEEASKVMDGSIGEQLAGDLPEKGLVGLGYWELGFRNLTNNRHAVTKAEDIAGLKIRTLQSPIYIDLFNQLGANAVPMPFPELYTALETGTVDGQENPASVILSSKFNEVQKYLTLTQHTYNPQILMISGKMWDKLNEEERTLIQDAANEARDYQRTVAREQNEKALDELKAGGMEVNALAPEETDKLRQMVQPVVDKYTQEVGRDLVQKLYNEIDKVRGKS